ncbi:MAG: DUF4350 domain-containing protein [Chloroflexota bacterium]|nr:DUF4350 domain-containing protein [Chloroflexota bacterium]
MMQKYRKFAPYGLVLGFLAALAALILRISTGQFTLGVKISIGIAILGLVLFVLLDPKTVLEAFKGRRAKYGGNALVLTLAVIGILVVVNLFIFNNDVSWDLTEDKVNTLAPETLDILNNLQLPVTAQAFYSSNLNRGPAETLLSNFKRNANGMFDYEFIDPYQDPVAANQAEITQDGAIVLTAGGQKDTVTFASESNLVNAIVKLQNPEQTAIYVLTGHGESDFFQTGDFAMTVLEQALENKNYAINALNLVSTPAIPDDAQALILAAPQIPLSQDEINLIADFLNNGGALVYFSEPPFLLANQDTQPPEQTEDPLWTHLQTVWGLELRNDLVVDLSVDPPELAVADQYGDHAITEALQGYVTIYPTSHSLQMTDVDGITTTELALTSDQSWAENDLEAIQNGEVGYDDLDLPGPVTLAVAMDNTITGGRIVVVGDSDFASDAYIQAYGNRDIATSMVDWAAQNENLINLTTAETTTRVLVPPTRGAQIAIIFGGLIGLPLLIGAIGVIISIQRKRTG